MRQATKYTSDSLFWFNFLLSVLPKKEIGYLCYTTLSFEELKHICAYIIGIIST